MLNRWRRSVQPLPTRRRWWLGAPPDIIDRYLESELAVFEAENSGLVIERRPVYGVDRGGD